MLKMALLGSAVITAATVAASPPATAAARTVPGHRVETAKKYHEKYNVQWTFKSKKIHRCIAIKAYGNISYTERVETEPHSPVQVYYWQNQTLNDPTLTIKITALRSNNSCGSAAKLVKVSMRQAWTGYSCTFNPSLGISAPWGISISGWPSCGNRNQAGYATTPPGQLSHYAQYNSGSPASFADYHVDPTPKPVPCYGVYPTIIAYLTGVSDSYGAGNAKAREVCLPWHT